MSTDPAHTPQPLRMAREALKKGRHERAVGPLTAYLVGHPDGAEAWELLGVAHAMAGETAAAREAFAEATRREPGRVSAHYNFAVFLADRGDLDEAAEENQAALYLDPRHPGALALQARLSERLRDRRRTSEKGFSVVGRGDGPRRDPAAPWSQLPCVSCGAMNFVTARTCARCGSYLPEVEEVVPVE